MRLKIFYLLLLFLFPFGASAVSPSSVLVNIAPENPAPNETVTITLSSYASNLDSVVISWSVDGKASASGIGLKSFLLKAPEVGKETRVLAVVNLPDGNIEKPILIRPGVMVLLWQAKDSYTPPFYKGKALPSADSSIKVVALPEIRNGAQAVSPKSLVYAWRKDYTNDQTASGYGKNFYIFTNDYLEDSNNVAVTASTTDQKYSSSGDMAVRAFPVKLLFYREDLRLGTVWEDTLENGHRIDGEEILVAAPYFITPKDIRLPSLTWDWSINGTRVPINILRKNVLPLKADAGKSGTSKVRLEISNKYKLLTSVAKEISLSF